MKVYNPTSDMTLHQDIRQWLNHYRQAKNFDAKTYIQAKAYTLNQYMTQCGLKSCVVAVSGGIDSAAVLAIVKYASSLPNSPIEKILPVLLPVFHAGATDQENATQRGQEVCASLDLTGIIIDLTTPHQIIGSTVSNNINIEGKAWAQGQLVAHTRTPTLYYAATLLTQENLPAIICGTTNRDEGLYLGYFGKASDGLVDVQMISDLHKSEVYQVAQFLHIAPSAIQVTPKGDMYDGRHDEEVFGAPYDFVEIYLYYLSLNKQFQSAQYNLLSTQAQLQFDFFAQNLENLHRYNRHKYFGASPAVHLDLDTLSVPEGWKTNCLFGKPENPVINTDNFVGYFKESALAPSFYDNILPVSGITHRVGTSSVIEVEHLLKKTECDYLLSQKAPWVLAGKYGTPKNFNPNIDQPGSQRASFYNEDLAQSLFMRVRSLVPHIKFNPALDIRIENSSAIWTCVGVNPLMRMIRYDETHFLVPHYDDTFEFNTHQKTLMSLIIYLNDHEAQTRFLYDSQTLLPEPERNYQDHQNLAQTHDVLIGFKAKEGSALIFEHRLLHDATEIKKINAIHQKLKTKTIIRTDIVFERPYFGFDYE